MGKSRISAKRFDFFSLIDLPVRQGIVQGKFPDFQASLRYQNCHFAALGQISHLVDADPCLRNLGKRCNREALGYSY